MLLLSLDTCGPSGTIALAHLSDGLKILAESSLPGKTYSARLIPAISELLAAHNAVLPDLDAIVATSGPGSFTGIRIALSTAKGLAEAHSIPVLAVSRLAVLAHKAQTPNHPIQAAALDASRHEFYLGDYSSPNPRESLLTVTHFQQLSSALGHHLAVCEESLLTFASHAKPVPPPTAADALHFALPRLRARDFDNPVALDGNYLRRSDAEIFSPPQAVAVLPSDPVEP